MITSEHWKTAKQHDGHCDRRNGSESTPIEKDDKIVEALKEVQVGLMKTENHSRTLLKAAKTWLIEVTFKEQKSKPLHVRTVFDNGTQRFKRNRQRLSSKEKEKGRKRSKARGDVALVSPLILGHPDFDLTSLPFALRGGAELLRDAEGDAGTSLAYPPDLTVSRWLRNLREPERQVAGWLKRLGEFDFEVIYRLGQKHQYTDALSRRVCKQYGLESSPAEVRVGAINLDAVIPIRQEQESDPELWQVPEWIVRKAWPQAVPQGLWLQRDLVIPWRNIPEVLAASHNQYSGAHLGVAKTLVKLRQWNYWPQQREDVEDWCWACQTCAEHASPLKKLRLLCSFNHSVKPSNDVVRLLLEVAGGVCAVDLATALVNGIFCRYGALETLHSDQDRNFDLYPQSDGLVEQMNRTLLNRLAKASIDHPVDWDAHLDEVLLANRSSVHHTTSQIVFSKELRLPVDLMYCLPIDVPEESVEEYTQRLRHDLEELYEAVREGLAESSGTRSSGQTGKPINL
ncbi:Gypsy retrotransposon integrase-like protein 1 [Trichinella sp. T9]|nr:Gypsy retrotransposon integrase-like protein 1 [Trichinella sp. T9]